MCASLLLSCPLALSAGPVRWLHSSHAHLPKLISQFCVPPRGCGGAPSDMLPGFRPPFHVIRGVSHVADGPFLSPHCQRAPGDPSAPIRLTLPACLRRPCPQLT